ncbi:unnamed protein product [Symbiodinium sp. KB8]|nr:unnamed protein product [Symbiodinium sp. KB8]
MTEPTAQTHSPHILTVFRTTNASVTLAFEITDATGKVITDQSAGVSLQQVARRLGEVTEDVENLWEEASSWLHGPSRAFDGIISVSGLRLKLVLTV